jgi:Na+/H+-dicarboxylate symporter
MLRRLSQISLSTWIFIGLGLGLFVGLFFGELCRPLNFIGKAFLRLLQMAVLPYTVVSLIHGVGSLSPTDAKLMVGKGLTMVVLFWLVGLAVIFAFSLVFPVEDSSSFFSVSEPHAHEPYKILEQYLPSNIFEALSDSLIPAVVLFSVFLGVALLGVRTLTVLEYYIDAGPGSYADDKDDNQDSPYRLVCAHGCWRRHSLC